MTTKYLESLLGYQEFLVDDPYFPLTTNYTSQLEKELQKDLKLKRDELSEVQPLKLSGLMKKY